MCVCVCVCVRAPLGSYLSGTIDRNQPNNSLPISLLSLAFAIAILVVFKVSQNADGILSVTLNIGVFKTFLTWYKVLVIEAIHVKITRK